MEGRFEEEQGASASMGSMQWSPDVGHHVMLDGLFALEGGWSPEQVRKGRFEGDDG